MATSLTGRFSRLAASAISAVRGVNVSLRAERAADIGADDANLSGVDAELLGHAVLEPIDELARLIDRQPVVVPRRRSW